MDKQAFLKKLCEYGIDTNIVCFNDSVKDDVFCVINNYGSSIASNAGGAKQMISLGKQSFSRTVSAIKQNGISAATATETKKAFKYYIRSTERVTENLFGKSSRLSTALNTLYSWGKSLFKRITG